MLLGIYDDLLMSGAAAAAQGGAYRLIVSGFPLDPHSAPQIVATRDLANWTVGAAPWVGFVASVAQGNELMLATGNAPDSSHPLGVNRMAVSKDYGATWAEVPMPANGLDTAFAQVNLAFGRGLFVACAQEMARSGAPGQFTGLSTSPDGLTWTARANPWIGPATPFFVNGLFVLVGYDLVNVAPAWATSVDGVSWTRRPPIWGTLPQPIRSVQYQNGQWIMCRQGTDGAGIAYSSDLANWSLAMLPCAGTGGFYADRVVWFKGQYYGFAYSRTAAPPNPYTTQGTISVSSDLKTWRVLATGLPMTGPILGVNLDGARMAIMDQTSLPLATFSAAGLSYSTPGPVFSVHVSSDMQNFSKVSVPANLWMPLVFGR